MLVWAYVGGRVLLDKITNTHKKSPVVESNLKEEGKCEMPTEPVRVSD